MCVPYTSTVPVRSEARKVDATDDTDLGEEALQRAARIEYAIKAWEIPMAIGFF